MDNIHLIGPKSFSTGFTSNKILKLINERLVYLGNPQNYKITEETYDSFYDENVPHSTATKIWHIEYFGLDNTPPNYDSFYKQTMYIIRVSFLEGIHGKPNIVEFMDLSDTRGYFLEDRIFSLKYFITKQEKLYTIRYLEREPILLLINGVKANYNDFNEGQINAEQKILKKLQMLEGSFMLREISEYIDYVPPIINNKILGRCF